MLCIVYGSSINKFSNCIMLRLLMYRLLHLNMKSFISRIPLSVAAGLRSPRVKERADHTPRSSGQAIEGPWGRALWVRIAPSIQETLCGRRCCSADQEATDPVWRTSRGPGSASGFRSAITRLVVEVRTSTGWPRQTIRTIQIPAPDDHFQSSSVRHTATRMVLRACQPKTRTIILLRRARGPSWRRYPERAT